LAVVSSSDATVSAGAPSRTCRENACQAAGRHSPRTTSSSPDHVGVVFSVPLKGEVAVRVLELVEHPVGLFGSRHLASLPPLLANTMDGDRSQPGAKRARSLVVAEAGEFPDNHRKHILGKVVRLLLGDVKHAEPAADQGQIDVNQPMPRIVVVATFQPVEQGQRRRHHLPLHSVMVCRLSGRSRANAQEGEGTHPGLHLSDTWSMRDQFSRFKSPMVVELTIVPCIPSILASGAWSGRKP
jgi:hypothetical protein